MKTLFALLLFAFTFSCSDKKNASLPEETSVKKKSVDTTNTELTSEQITKDIHSSENSLDWPGTYVGNFPCKDCEEIIVTVVLKDNNSFTITEEFKGKNFTTHDSGNFSWDASGSIIALKGKSFKARYMVGENTLFRLDKQGKIMENPNKKQYVLNKKN
ncbi:MAG: copper resistance protein NlpE [Bergeyella sp.]|nr:copper resistance protein NlpE [Bergeyella sp.]